MLWRIVTFSSWLLASGLGGGQGTQELKKWKRISELRPAPYECIESPRPAPRQYPDFLRCFGEASDRIHSLEHAHLAVYPISFCYPKSLAAYYWQRFRHIEKTTYITGGLHGHNSRSGTKSYQVDDEEEYLRRYATAHFVGTTRKSGWDCNRHLEILAAGSIPLMERYQDIPPNTMFHYPKECFPVFWDYYEKNDTQALGIIRNAVHDFFMEYNTCEALGRFMTRALHFSPCSEGPVLLLDEALVWKADYQSIHVLLALRDMIGPNLHIWREPDYMYNNFTGDYHLLYGNGMGYAYVLNASEWTGGLPNDVVVARLKAGYYKLVVYGKWSFKMMFFDEVAAVLPPQRIWAINGADRPPLESYDAFVQSAQSSWSTLFVRELTTEPRCGVLPLAPDNMRRKLARPQLPACLAPAPPVRLPSVRENRCFRNAERRIQETVFTYQVYPLTMCLPSTTIQSYNSLRATPRTVPFFFWNETWRRGSNSQDAIAARMEQLAVSHAVHADLPTAWDSLFFLEALAAGTAPKVTRPLDGWALLEMFHAPRECIRSAAQAHTPTGEFREAAYQYLRQHMNCGALARFMFDRTHVYPCGNKSVLFVDTSLAKRPRNPFSLMVLIGLKELLGSNVHVWYEPSYIYRDGTTPDFTFTTVEVPLYGQFCAFELETCVCDGTVSFGVPGRFFQQEVRGAVQCSARVFNDSAQGIPKACYCKPIEAPELADYSGHFTHVLDPAARGPKLTAEDMEQRLRDKVYEVVVFGDLDADKALLAMVKRNRIAKSRVWILGSRGPIPNAPFVQFHRALAVRQAQCHRWTNSSLPESQAQR